VTAPEHWTGYEARLLRTALRLSSRAFAAHLGVGERTVSKWEKAGRSTRPWPETQAILDTALARASEDARARFAQLVEAQAATARPGRETRPDEPVIGDALFGVQQSDAGAEPDADPEAGHEAGMRRRPVLHGILVGAGSALGAAALHDLGPLERVRRSLDRLLEGSGLGGSTLERWEALPSEYGRRYQLVAPAHLLDEIANDLVELHYLLSLEHTTTSRTVMCRVGSQLASLAGIFLAAQGNKRNAQHWFHTAGLAAKEAADPRLAGLALVRSGIVWLYHGAPERALAKLAKAQALLGNAPTPSRARALVAEARAQAMLGKQQEAQRRLDEAEITFGDMPAAALGDPALGWTERQFYGSVGNVYTLLGRTAEAGQLQRQALSMYQPTEHLDPALIHLDESRCLVSQGDVDSACQNAVATITAVPPEHRGLVVHYGRSFFNELSRGARATASGRALKELLAGQRASV